MQEKGKGAPHQVRKQIDAYGVDRHKSLSL